MAQQRRFELIEQMAQTYEVAELCQAFEVSRSGWYMFRHKEERLRRQEDKKLVEELQIAFWESRQTYGSPRLTQSLRAKGILCGKNRVSRLMRQAGLRPKQKRRRWPRTTDAKHSFPVAENWLAKLPSPDRPNQTWVADITYVETREGWLYLAGVLDACSRRVVGYAMREDLSAHLVTEAWNRAWRNRRPRPGLLHHSDRGVQYASHPFRSLLRKCRGVASMSRRGNCYDNAMMESFWATLKTEALGSLSQKQERRLFSVSRLHRNVLQ